MKTFQRWIMENWDNFKKAMDMDRISSIPGEENTLHHLILKNQIRGKYFRTADDVKKKLSGLHNELSQEEWDSMTKRDKCGFMGMPYTKQGYAQAEQMWRDG